MKLLSFSIFFNNVRLNKNGRKSKKIYESKRRGKS